MNTYKDIKSWDEPKSLQSKPMARHLARSYFFYHSVFFTSKAFNRMTSSVKAVPTHLTINSFSQRISSPLLFSSLLCNIDSTLKPWQPQKRKKKINHSLSQIRSCTAYDKVNWTMIYFIFAGCHHCHWHAHSSFPITWFNTQISHTQTDARCTGSEAQDVFSTRWRIDWSLLRNICFDPLQQ